jgi:hypothetical protein
MTQYPSAARIIKNSIAQLAFRIPMEPEPPITGLHWYPGRSNHTQNSPYFAVEPPIGVQDTRHMSEDWRFGRQASDNEHTLYIELYPGFQIGVQEGARSL